MIKKKYCQPIVKHGFTLIELLVVISIIGILASLALASYSGTQKQARDNQRKSDLNQYRIALENYANINNGSYPVMSYPNPVGNICDPFLAPDFISFCIDDPLSDRDYYYQSNGEKYVIYADLERGGFWYICSSGKSAMKESDPNLNDCP